MNPTIDLGEIQIDGYKFAINANAILGTRNAGKTFAGKHIAESLIDINVPIIFLDPVGRARFMKQANPNNPNGKGYPVVVVGKDADIELSLDTIENVIMMALQTRSSLIIDLYAKEYDDIKDEIVSKVCEVLYHENEKYGLRTLIVEESSDFLGQTSKKTQASVWLTKLTRYSGNFKLGIVFLNQNAESLSKEVLKLCKGMLLGIQNETNSIKMIRKWLNGGGVKNAEEISETLPNLTTGQFWMWAKYLESQVPVLTKIPMIKSNHPSREDISPRDVLPSEDIDSVISLMKNLTPKESVSIPFSQVIEIMQQMTTVRAEMSVNIEMGRLSSIDVLAVSQARKTRYGSSTVAESIDDIISKGYNQFSRLSSNFGYLVNGGRVYNLNSKLELDYAEIALRNLVNIL